ncbi:unnamed protein product [Rangifer tarandus platyrhynchus]|uniref:Uncharacterized protein n=1 Tax=Rangifer tarandus platyrhynchus TaxID=3082113 RepID=A0AC59Z949_RANTA
MILVIWESGLRTQSPDCSLVFCLHNCYLPSEVLQMLILIRNRFLAVFSNLRSLFHPSVLGLLYVDSVLFSILFPFSLAHFSKPKLAEKWKWRLTNIHLSGSPS